MDGHGKRKLFFR